MSLRYTRVAIALHWLIAAVIFCTFLLGLYMADLPVSPWKLRLYSYHKWIGVTIFALVIARIAWRLTHAAPALPTMPAWQRIAAHASHALLYLLTLAVPITGWLFSSAAGFQTVYLGVLPIPDLIAKNKAAADALKAAHWYLNLTMLTLVAVHVAAALKHHFVDRDDVLARMLPAAKTRT
ncbi:MAG TPA: cytochrome b [Burkholderiales bacterium]|nr:cytochrome b [Burkholderiales bacterium]